MKKLLGFLLTTLLLCSGCAQQATAQGSQPVESQSDAKGAMNAQLAENQTRVYGKIQEISGNEIVLAIGTMQMPEGTSGMAPGASGMIPGASGGMKPGARTRPGSSGNGAAAGGQTSPDMPAPPDGQAFPSGEMPSFDKQGDKSGAASGSSDGKTGRGNRAGGMQGGFGGFSIELTYTGETKTLQIPVGLKITTGMGANAKESDFTTLAKDNVIAVVLEKGSDGTEKVVSVRLMS